MIKEKGDKPPKILKDMLDLLVKEKKGTAAIYTLSVYAFR
jgi:hypothetical protein